METTVDKLQTILNSKNAIRDKFGLPDDLPFSQYAENIQSGGETSFYECVSVDTESLTWSGYKAYLTANDAGQYYYAFEEVLTENLTYGNGFTPEVGSIYDEGAKLLISQIHRGDTALNVSVQAIIGGRKYNDIGSNQFYLEASTSDGSGTIRLLSDSQQRSIIFSPQMPDFPAIMPPTEAFLPDWSVSDNGSIYLTGKPSAVGTFTGKTTVVAELPSGATLRQDVEFTLEVEEGRYILITDQDDVSLTQGVAMSPIQLQAQVIDDGTPEFGFGDDSDGNDLPEGLSMSSDGVISGTPTKSGNTQVCVYVRADLAETKTILFNIEVAAEISVTTPVTISGIQANELTAVQLEATVSDGSSPTFTASGLPSGITCSESGVISGTPTSYGSYTSTVTVSSSVAESKTIYVYFTIAEGYTETETVFAVQANSNTGSCTAVGFYITSGREGVIDWGDGEYSEIISSGSSESYEHDYGTAFSEEHIVRIRGTAIEKITPASDDTKTSNAVTRIIQLGSSLTTLANFCYSNKGLTRIEDTVQIPSGVTSMCEAFYDCSSLTYAPASLRFPAGCNLYSWAFCRCEGLEADITHWFDNFASISSGRNFAMNNAFSLCYKVTGTLPADLLWNNSNIDFTATIYAFYRCTLLTNYADIPSEWGGEE